MCDAAKHSGCLQTQAKKKTKLNVCPSSLKVLLLLMIIIIIIRGGSVSPVLYDRKSELELKSSVSNVCPLFYEIQFLFPLLFPQNDLVVILLSVLAGIYVLVLSLVGKDGDSRFGFVCFFK